MIVEEMRKAVPPGVRIEQNDEDLITLHKYASITKDCYVEIGTFQGGSILAVEPFIPPEVKIFTIDIDPDTIKAKSKRVNYFAENSLNLANHWEHSIGTLFIDGDHHLALDDFKAWSKYVIPGGYILFHDYDPLDKLVGRDVHQILEYGNGYIPLKRLKKSSIFILKKEALKI